MGYRNTWPLALSLSGSLCYLLALCLGREGVGAANRVEKIARKPLQLQALADYVGFFV